jgi:hypothetical protein
MTWTSDQHARLRAYVAGELCPTCLRPPANFEDWKTYKDGEGAHLCWEGFTCDEDPAFDLRAEISAMLDEIKRLRGLLRQVAIGWPSSTSGLSLPASGEDILKEFRP